MTSRLQSLQEAVAARLKTYPELNTAGVHAHSASDTAGLVEQTVAKGTGVCVVVMPPLPDRTVEGAAGPVFEEVTVRVHVIENPWTNTSGQSALALAEQVSRALHLWQPNLPGWAQPLRLAERRPWRELNDRDYPERYTLEVNVVATGAFRIA